MSKPRHHFIPYFERLESREVPAGNVTVTFKKNLLSIVGDNESNGILLSNNGDGSFTIDTTTGETTLNGRAGPLTLTSTTFFAISINMRGGNDTVHVIGGKFTLAKNASIKLGQGNDTLLVDGVFIQQHVKIDGGAGNDTINVSHSQFNKSASIAGSVGNDTISIDDTTFAKRAWIDAGNGNDVIGVHNGQFGTHSRILGRSGFDEITITASEFGEDGRIDAGTADDTVSIANSVFFREFRFFAGNGADIATFTNNRFDFDARFDMGQGGDELLLGGNIFNKQAGYTGGSGFDTFTHDGSNIWAAKHKVKRFERFQLDEVTPPPAEVVANDDTGSCAPGLGVAIAVLTNDFASAPYELELSSVVVVTPPVFGFTSINDDGSISYINTSNAVGTDTFTYTVSDNQGNVSNIATVTITITNEGELFANSDHIVVDEGGQATIDVLHNDTTPAGTTFVPSSVAVAFQPSHGTVVVNTDGTITYTHDGSEPDGFPPVDSFWYTFTNSAGDTSFPAVVTIFLNPVNDAPWAMHDEALVLMGMSTNINLVSNDSDPESQLDLSSIAIVQGPASGNVTVNADGTVTYLALAGSGDSFTYTIKDQQGLISNVASVNIQIL